MSIFYLLIMKKKTLQIDRRIDMGETRFVFGLMGMSFGSIGFVFGIILMGRLDKLVKHLKENDVIDKDYKF